ncbi:MAG: cupredoxin domain-containing protein [Thermoanaerobaculia bacterium]
MPIVKLVVAIALVMPSLLFAATFNVSVGPGFSFSPPTVTVAPGDTVRWNFLATHTTTSDLQTGPEVWDSGVLSSGFFTHTFNTPGNYPYYCFLHSSPGGTFMNGVVQVVAASTLTGVNPASGSIAGGTGVTLTGTNFLAPCTVDFGGAAGTAVAVPSSTTITTTTPAHAAGPVTVTVNCGGGGASLPGGFTFNNAPTITSFNPASGLPGTTVTITGTGFQSGATVSFGGVASPTVNFGSSSSLTAVVPNMPAGPASITVTNPDTLSATAPGFLVLALAIPLMSREVLMLMAIVIGIAAAINIKR